MAPEGSAAALVTQVEHVIFPVAVVIFKGAEAVTAGVPDEVPAVHVGVPATACVVIARLPDV
jgi:hypothetical protein